MKYVLEFGVKSGFHVENVILPSLKLGMQLASGMVCTFANDSFSCTPQQWIPQHPVSVKRMQWESATHFVALSKLDGVDRGPASAVLWRKGQSLVMVGQVIHS